MDYRKFGNQYVIRLDRGEEIVKKLKEVAQKENIKLAYLTGIGAVGEVTAGVFDTKEKEQHKPTDTIKIVKIFDRKTALFFQDMFPATARYIDGQYIKGGQTVRIADPKLILE